MNVDQAEISKFEAIAEQWWDQDGKFRPLHDINPLRLNFIEERCRVLDKAVLDVGCGGGILSEGLAHRGARVTGIDMGEAPLAVARIHSERSGLSIDYRQQTVEALAEEVPGTFDVVACMEMLEHVPDPASVISACYQLLKPGGHLFLSTINRNPKAWMMAIVGAEYILNLLPRGTHQYSKFIKPAEMATWCRRTGLAFQEVVGMTYNPITQVYRLGRDVDVNYLAHATRPAE